MKLRGNETRWSSGIFEASLKGVQHHLTTMWESAVVEPPLFVKISSTNDLRKAIEQDTNRKKDEALQLPYLSVTPGVWDHNTAGYNPFVMKTRGIGLGSTPEGLHVREKVSPVDLGVNLRFVSRDFQEAKVFANLCMLKNPISGFYLVHQQSQARIKIKIRWDPQVNVPPADFGGEPGDLFAIETNLIVSTYAGETELQLYSKRVLFEAITPGATNKIDVLDTWQVEGKESN